MNDQPGGRFPRWLQALWQVGPAVIYGALTFVGGSIRQAESGLPVGDKTLHLVSFGVMTWLVFRANRYLLAPAGWSTALGSAFVVTVGVGGALEVWQSFLPYRTADWLDLAADAVGAGGACAVIVAAVMMRRHLA